MVKDLFASLFDVTKNIIFAKKARVLFYYPQHFNRTIRGTNPFFDTLLEVCERNGIKYKLVEEPDYSTDKHRNDNAIKGDILYWLILILRKVVNAVCKKNDFYHNEKHVADVLNILTLGRLRYNTYITISGSMFHLLPQLKKGSIVYDMQHGVMYGHQLTYFNHNNFRLKKQFYPKNLHWLLWGKGYEECFTKGEEQYLQGKVHTVGYPIRPANKWYLRKEEDFLDPPTILFSLQFTADGDVVKLVKAKQMIIKAIETLKGCNVRVLLKHHPRYNNVIDIDDIYKLYDYVEETKEPLNSLILKTILQVTFNSTTAFEYAEYGIPSYFLSSDEFQLEDNLFYCEYSYPLYKNMSIDKVIERLQDYSFWKQDSEVVKQWYNKFYAPFDENVFLSLLR